MDDVVVAVFSHHHAADVAVRRLVAAGWDRERLSVVGKRCHASEGAIAFHRPNGTARFPGLRAEFWGSLWALFVGGLFLTFPGAGIVVVLGCLAATTILTADIDSVAGSFGALMSAIGVPPASAVRYEGAVKADGFLVMAHGSSEEIKTATKILDAANPLMLDTHAWAERGDVTRITSLHEAR